MKNEILREWKCIDCNHNWYENPYRSPFHTIICPRCQKPNLQNQGKTGKVRYTY